MFMACGSGYARVGLKKRVQTPFSSIIAMSNKKLLPAILNLLTGVGGHFYNRRVDRVVFIMAIVVLLIVLYFLGTFFLGTSLSGKGMSPPVNYVLYLYEAFLLSVLSLLIYSAYLGYVDAGDGAVGRPLASGGQKFSAITLSLIGGLFVFYQFYVSAFFFIGTTALTKTTSADGKEHKYAYSTFSNDPFYWNGYSLKRYDEAVRNPDLPDPPGGDGLLTGQILLNDTPVQDFVFDLVLDGQYRAKGVTTDKSGTFTIPIQAGIWHIDYIAPKSWPDKPKNKKFIMLTGREDVLRGNHYRDHKYMDYEEGLPVEVVSEKRSTLLIFRIKEKLTLTQPAEKNQKANVEDYKIQWRAYPDANEYLVEISEITREADTTHFTPVSSVRINNATELPLSRFETISNANEAAEYEVKIYAFDLAGNFLSKSEDYSQNNTFMLVDGKKLLSDRFKQGFEPGEFNVKDAEQMMENQKRIRAAVQLIDDHLYPEAENLLGKISGKTRPGSREAVTGYLFAAQNQCDKANPYFDKALSMGGRSCLPMRYRENCRKSQ